MEDLRYLAELRFLSLPQMARLCCPAERRDLSEKSARRHLRSLFDAGLVDVLPVSRAALAPPDAKNDASLLHGSAPNVYAPTREGLRLLVRPATRGRTWLGDAPSYGPKNTLFLAHELLVRDVRVWLEECARTNGHAVERWEDGEAAAIPLDGRGHPRSSGRTPGSPTGWARSCWWGWWRRTGAPSGADRRWREKLEAYAALYAGAALREATGYVNARVLVVCPDARRRDRLAASLPEWSQQTGLPTELLERIWLVERGALAGTNLGEATWRRTGSGAQWPLVPAQELPPIEVP